MSPIRGGGFQLRQIKIAAREVSGRRVRLSLAVCWWYVVVVLVGFGHSLLSLRGRHCPYASALDTLCCPCVVATVLMHGLWTLFIVCPCVVATVLIHRLWTLFIVCACVVAPALSLYIERDYIQLMLQYHLK